MPPMSVNLSESEIEPYLDYIINCSISPQILITFVRISNQKWTSCGGGSLFTTLFMCIDDTAAAHVSLRL